MKLIQFTHANTKQPVMVSEGLAFSWWYSPIHKSTYIMGNGGAIIPVIESFEEVTRKVQEARNIPETKTTTMEEKSND